MVSLNQLFRPNTTATAATHNAAPTTANTGAAQQRTGVMGRMAAASQSLRTHGRHLRDGMFRARQGDATTVPRSARAAPAAATTPAAPPVEMEMAARLNMTLDGERLVLGTAGSSNRAEKLLDGVLNKPGERYQSVAELTSTGGKSEYLLIDVRDRLVHAHASDLAVSVFKSSQTGINPAAVTTPDAAHRAQITGVHVDSDNQAWRIHEKKLYALQGGEWRERARPANVKSLHSMGDGQVYALGEDGKVRSLQKPNLALDFTHKVSALGATSTGGLIALSTDDDGNTVLERLKAFSEDLHDIQPLRLPAGIDHAEAFTPKSVAVIGDTLFATSASGKLLKAHIADHDTMPSLDPDAPPGTRVRRPPTPGLELQLQVDPPRPRLQDTFGEHSFSSLFHDEQGNLHARVKDQKGIEHSAPWDTALNDFRPGWHMGALVMDRQKGLPALLPEASQQIRLARGAIARHGDDLLTQDPRTEEWKKTSETDIKGLIASKDGFAYLIDKDNKLKQLKVAPQATAHDLGKGLDLALPGRGTEAKGTILRGAEHLSVEKAAVQNDQRYLTLSGGTLRLHDQNGERATLPAVPGNGNITGIASEGKDWFALRDGVVQQLSGAAADPKSLSADRQWQTASTVGLPEGATAQDLYTDNEGRMCLKASVAAPTDADANARADREFVHDDNGRWTPATPTAPAAGTNHQHFNDLAAGEPDFTRRGNIKTNVNVLGRNNVETARLKNYAPNTLTQNYVTSHLASTGAFKVPADSVQHAWSGREGLKAVYRHEIDALKELRSDASHSPLKVAQSTAARLEKLDSLALTPEMAELSEIFKWFHQSVADDMQKTLRELAQDKGALLRNGDNNLAFRPGKPPKTDLLAEVSQVLKNNGGTDTDELGAMIKSLRDHGFTLEHRNPESSLDKSRVRGDNQALLCARLAVNVQVMKELSSQLDRMVVDAEQPHGARPERIAQRLADLHNDAWEGNPIKRYTDAGFRSYAALEASYDATKSLLKYLRKENHPVKRNALESLKSSNDAELKRNLTQALKELEPRESLKITRNYGGGITGGVSGPAGDSFLGFRGSIDPDRTYGLTFTRFDRGLKVALNREGTISGTASFGFGGGVTDVKTTPGDSHENHQTNGGWFGASLDAKHKYSDNTALSFFIRDDELEGFMNDLMTTPLHRSKHPDGGGLKPMELLNRSVEQEVRTTAKHNFDLELGANVESRTNYGQTDAEPVAGFMRFGVGLLANAALLSAERERTQGRGNDGLKTDIYSSNRARFLEKGSVTGYGRMFSTIFTSRPDNLFVAGGAPMGIAASLSLDSKTGKSYDVRFKDALPVQASDVKSLESGLEKAFPELKRDKADERSVDERLASLHTQYGSQPAVNDAQHSALMSLAQTRRQQQASAQGGSLMSLMDMVVKHSNVNRVDQAALTKRGIDVVKQMLGKDVNPGNAERIHELMNADPQLKTLLDELKSAKGTTRAELKLEVTDSLKKEIEDAAIKGTLSDAGLKNQLSNRDNLRIKSIAIFTSAAKDDSLGVPLPYVSFKSGSALAIERLRGEVSFEYGLDQTTPKKFSLDGELADKADSQPAREMAVDDHGAFRPA